MKTRQTTFRIHFNRLVSTTLSRPWTKNIFILFHGGGGVGRSVWMRGRQMLKFFGQDHHRHGHRHHRSADLLRLWKFSLCFNRYSQITNHKMHIRSSLLANVIRSNWDTMTSSFAVKKLFQSIYFLWRFPHFVWLSPTIYLHSYLPTSYLPTYLPSYLPRYYLSLHFPLFLSERIGLGFELTTIILGGKTCHLQSSQHYFLIIL